MARLLIAGIHQGTMTAVVTANVKEKDLQVIAVIIILAGLWNGVFSLRVVVKRAHLCSTSRDVKHESMETK